MSPVIIT